MADSGENLRVSTQRPQLNGRGSPYRLTSKMWPFSSSSWKEIAQHKVKEREKALETALPTFPDQSVFLAASGALKD